MHFPHNLVIMTACIFAGCFLGTESANWYCADLLKMNDRAVDLKNYIRDVQDFPKKGILFRDITPLLGDPRALKTAIDVLSESFGSESIEYVAAIDARGFIFGAAVARQLGVGFVPIRKKGKLPYKTESVNYDLEYGIDTLEIHTDAVKKGAGVLLIDDLLATGGTMAAACELVGKIGGKIIGIAFLVELCDLSGRDKLKDYEVKSIIAY